MLSFSFFCEAVNEDSPRTRSEQNHCPKPTRFALSRACDALLDHATTEVGGNKSSLGVPDRLAQPNIVDTSLFRKAHERLVLEYAHL